MARGAWRIDSWRSAPSQCWSSAAAGQIGWWRSTPSRRWSSAEQRHARTEALLRIRRYDASYSERAALADATRVVLRPLGPGDTGRLAAAFARLSQRTRALRFLCGKSELSPDELRKLSDVDGEMHFAIVACLERARRDDRHRSLPALRTEPR